ncbi:MAG: hypothetical protein A2V76_02400 [Candidatus Aminicenantes bacterium RBG_16_63_14]|nr:MAG: hypothetical protein A2V76_02400 [Candidatus Aminicenantes bacterium RBG_16_63_14]OGD29069.1 MAG: hypothetical protein A2V57_05450 [Candidatus Aminicenantes bacterium RBG_19FT_COMBO_65_30]
MINPEAVQDQQSIEVSFVLPCLNEENTLPIALGYVKEAIARLGSRCEIIAADNGSTDRTGEIAGQNGARIVCVEKRGYGSALLSGIQAARGRYIVMGDADGTYDFREATAFIERLRNHEADMIIGSRLKGKIDRSAMPFLHRYLGTPVLSFLIRTFFKLRISDCNCGMRAFTKAAFERMHLISTGMEFASEMLIKAGVLGLRVEEIPCSLYKDQRDRKPHLKTWRDGWRHLKFILIFAPKWLFLIPGIGLLVLGIIPTVMLMFGKITMGSIEIDSHFILVFSILIICGYQIIWLYKFGYYFVVFSGYFKKDKEPSFALEKTLIIALVLFFVGLGLGIYSGLEWLKTKYSSIANLRVMMLGVDFIFLAILTGMNAFMLSTLNIRIRRSS